MNGPLREAAGTREEGRRLPGRTATMDARTEHLVALVKDGARLVDAGRVYGISAERVRQLLKEAGMTARDLPGRAEKPRRRRFALARELAPIIEAMWREGMHCHEIAEVFDVSCEAVHRLVCERVPPRERAAHTAARREDGRSTDARLLQGVRKAASVLADSNGIGTEERRRTQAVIDGWLTAHSQLRAASDATSPSEPKEVRHSTLSAEPVSAADLCGQLDRFKAGLRAGGLSGSTIHAYLLGSSLFVRWLAGDYEPRGRPSVGRNGAAAGAES